MKICVGHFVVSRKAASVDKKAIPGSDVNEEPSLKRSRAELSLEKRAENSVSAPDRANVPKDVVMVTELSERGVRDALRRYALQAIKEMNPQIGSEPGHNSDEFQKSWLPANDDWWPYVTGPSLASSPLSSEASAQLCAWETWSFCFVPGVMSSTNGTTHDASNKNNNGVDDTLTSTKNEANTRLVLSRIPLPRGMCVDNSDGVVSCVTAVLTEPRVVPLSPCVLPPPPVHNSAEKPCLTQDVKSQPLLLVGAGGIGCEVLKVLVLSGFSCIHLIDLDTIDATNLNRQFLFQLPDVGHSKAETARRVVLDWWHAENERSEVEHSEESNIASSDTAAVSTTAATLQRNWHASSARRKLQAPTIVAYHDNIKAAHFDDAFYHQFRVVLNALDNVSARQHVNRMCMRNAIPLIESGTMGYNGQVQPIVKGRYECYDCRAKPPDTKTFAVCTIHARPTTMVHCVHYAKELYEVLFGTTAAAASSSTSSAAEEGGKTTSEAVREPAGTGKKTLEELIQEDDGAEEEERTPAPNEETAPTQRSDGGELSYLRAMVAGWRQRLSPNDGASTQAAAAAELGATLLRTLFVEKVEELLSLKSSWSTQPPAPLSRAEIDDVLAAHLRVLAETPSQRSPLSSDEVLSVRDCMELFERAVEECLVRGPGVAFKKEDNAAVRFVSATANLRAHVFHIARQSVEEVRSIAGSIVPAIATTNAIIAAAVVHELMSLLLSLPTPSQNTFNPFSNLQEAAGNGVVEVPRTPQVVYARKVPQTRRRRLPPFVGCHHLSPSLFLQLPTRTASGQENGEHGKNREDLAHVTPAQASGDALRETALSLVGTRCNVDAARVQSLRAAAPSIKPTSVTDAYVVHSTVPNPPDTLHCLVCQDVHPEMVVQLDVATVTLGAFVRAVLEERLGFDGPSVSHGATMLYEAEDYEVLADHTLATLLQPGTAQDTSADAASSLPSTSHTRARQQRFVLTADALNKDVAWNIVLLHSAATVDRVGEAKEEEKAPRSSLADRAGPFTFFGIEEAMAAEENALRRLKELRSAEEKAEAARHASATAASTSAPSTAKDEAPSVLNEASGAGDAAEVVISDDDGDEVSDAEALPLQGKGGSAAENGDDDDAVVVLDD